MTFEIVFVLALIVLAFILFVSEKFSLDVTALLILTILFSGGFLTVEEPIEEILKERVRNYKENNKEIDFWLLKNPSFLQTTQFVDLKAKIPSPPAAILSTDKKFITFLKLRLEFVAVGEFEFPNAEITDPFKLD